MTLRNLPDGRQLLIALLILVALTGCSAPAAPAPPTAVAQPAPPTLAPTATAVVNSAPSAADETPTLAPEVTAAIAALSLRYDEKEAFTAVVAALERGYDAAQLQAAIEEGRLEPDGRILAADGSRLRPAGPDRGLIDLSGLESEAAKPAPRRARSATLQAWGITPDDLYGEVEPPEPPLTKAEGEAYWKTALIIGLVYNGYNTDQIVEWIVLGNSGDYILNDGCYFLGTRVDGEPRTIQAANAPLSPCAEAKPDEKAPLLLPTVTPTATAVADPGEGDLEVFCDIYTLMTSDLDRRIGAYEAAVGRDDGTAHGIAVEGELVLDDFFDQLAEVAPPEIAASVAGVADNSLVGVFTTDSFEEDHPDVVTAFQAVDDYAVSECGLGLGE